MYDTSFRSIKDYPGVDILVLCPPLLTSHHGYAKMTFPPCLHCHLEYLLTCPPSLTNHCLNSGRLICGHKRCMVSFHVFNQLVHRYALSLRFIKQTQPAMAERSTKMKTPHPFPFLTHKIYSSEHSPRCVLDSLPCTSSGMLTFSKNSPHFGNF